MYNVLVVEDEKRVADLLRAGLEENGYSVMVAYDGEMALRLFRSHEFHLVISDVILPRMNGFDLCKEIRQTNKRASILILTALGTADDKLEGFDAGADDYMVKPFDFRELMARVKVLTKRQAQSASPKPPQRLSYADLSIDVAKREVRRGETLIALSPKEYNLLSYLVENADRVVSRMEIAEKVWNTHFDTGTNFIDVCVNYLRKKVDRDFEVKLIQTRPGVGFILTK
ncbi:MAG: response regulator transcription factor [Prevotellaceae bacterium]|nr:response regulator transcription factor [Prevotellaceae bacterium]